MAKFAIVDDHTGATIEYVELDWEYDVESLSLRKEKPVAPSRWVHFCEKCVYLGQLGNYDIYFHGYTDSPDFIARRSNEDSDYLSGDPVHVPVGDIRVEVGSKDKSYWEARIGDPKVRDDYDPILDHPAEKPFPYEDFQGGQ